MCTVAFYRGVESPKGASVDVVQAFRDDKGRIIRCELIVHFLDIGFMLKPEENICGFSNL